MAAAPILIAPMLNRYGAWRTFSIAGQYQSSRMWHPHEASSEKHVMPPCSAVMTTALTILFFCIGGSLFARPSA